MVIPTYNRARFIGESIASVVAQGGVVTEIVVVDDGSTDDTLDRLAGMGEARLRVLSQANQGPAAARNLGWRSSRGEFVQFLDSDDILPPATSARMLEVAREVPGSVVYGDVTYHGLNVRGPVCARGAIAHRSGWIIGEVSRMSFGTIFASMFPRAALERIGGFDTAPEFAACEDFDFALRMAMAFPFVRVPEPCYCVRLHDSNRHTSSHEPMHAARLASVRRRIPGGLRFLALKRRALAFHAGLIADGRAGKGDYREAFRGYVRSLAWWPLKLRAYGAIVSIALASFGPGPGGRGSTPDGRGGS